MGIRILNSHRRALILDEGCARLAVLADARGRTRIVAGPELRLSQDGRLLLLELSSQAVGERELIEQISPQQTLTLGFGSPRGEFLNVVAIALERHTVGRLFQSLHEQIAATRDDAELLAVWVLEAVEVEGEEDGFPFLSAGSSKAFATSA